VAAILYRARQFWLALTAAPTLAELQAARSVLAPPLMALFSRMQPGEQAHSLAVYRSLAGQGQNDPDVLAAALLHDVGKTCCPLRVWERALIVIAYRLAPRRAKTWGASPEPAAGWRRPFVTAEQHPTWGAQMAQAAGASPLTVDLIRRHQDRLPGQPQNKADRLLQQLQRYDNES